MVVNVDLQKERKKCTFDVEELTNLIDGGIDKTKLRRETLGVFFENNNEINNGVPEVYLSHKEKYENSVKKSIIFLNKLRKQQEEGVYNLSNYREDLLRILQAYPYNDGSPLGMNFVVFIPAIFSQGNTEQQAYWISKALNWELIGCLAQTEMGHGTYIRGIETTATYDAETKDFVLHSPTLTSYKWWPGGLGQAANYCIAAAQLYTKGVCHGIHYFVVQIRDLTTHVPLPGVKVGEIGAKMGYNAVNHGFLGLEKVRVPRDYMLTKHAQILEDGTYIKSRNNKLNYSSMVYLRVFVISNVITYLSSAVTIAVRYSAVRRQSQLKEGEQENQILDYTTQQHKLFIAIASSYALRSTASFVTDTYNKVTGEMDDGNFERLSELHALTCCLKAVCTSDVSRFVESCKLSCGGHGYMLSSSLPTLYALSTAACTYEGDNTVLLLQTARFLTKNWSQLDNGKLTPTLQYIRDVKYNNISNIKWENTVDNLIKCFQIVATRKIQKSFVCLQKRVDAGMSFEDAWNITSVQLVGAAEAHCRLLILTSFENEVRKTVAAVSPALELVIRQLVDLYAVYWSLEKIGDLLQYTLISEKDIIGLQKWYEDLLCCLRPNAVGLVDAFDIHDQILQSTLGSYDGRVYERLMEEALKSPLNAEPVNQTFHKYLKPIMQGKL